MSTTDELRGRRVLLVEDVAALRMLCAARLEQAGACVTAVEGLEAARGVIASSVSFDVACIDLSLPDGDGARLVAELTPVPCVAFTAHEDAEARVTTHGFVASIDKVGGADPVEVLAGVVRQNGRTPCSAGTRPRRLSAEGPAEIKARYIRFLAEQRSALRSAFSREIRCTNAPAVRSAIHRIKGTAVHFELPAVSSRAAALGSALRSADEGRIGPLWREFEDAMAAAIEQHHLTASLRDANETEEEIARCAS